MIAFLLIRLFLLTSKNMTTGNTPLIRYEAELAHEFARLVAQDARLHELKIGPIGQKSDLSLQIDGAQHHFELKYLLTPTVGDIPTPNPNSPRHPLLVVPKLTDSLLDACRKKQVSVADLNGRIYLRGPNLLVALSPLPNRRFRFELEPRNVFVGKSLRIVRSLLSDPKRNWRQADLVERTGATSGLVSRIVTHLTRQGLLKKIDARRFHVGSPLALLDAWAQADDFGRRATTRRYAAFEADSQKLAENIRDALTQSGLHFAFTQWIAAWARHPHTQPPVVSLYVPHLPSNEVLEGLGLRPVGDAGRVWFHLPADEGVFRETRTVQFLPLVSDAQIYIDLLNTGLRGPEQAQDLREWSDFLQP